MCAQRMFLTCLNEVAVVTTWAVPGSFDITHQATIRAAKWLLPGAWHAGTAVLLLSLTDSRISRCFDHNVSFKPCSTKPIGSDCHCAHGLRAICSNNRTITAFSSTESLAKNFFRSCGVACLRNAVNSAFSDFVEEVRDTLFQFVHRDFKLDRRSFGSSHFKSVVPSPSHRVTALQIPGCCLPRTVISCLLN